MQSQEWLESRRNYPSGLTGTYVKLSDALVAIELKELETKICFCTVYKEKIGYQEQLSELKKKNNIL